MEISNPRRILLLGPPGSGHLDLLKELTGTLPTPSGSSLAGESHALSLKTAYYEATIPIWIDEISISDPSAWSSEFLQPEAKEVLTALGGFILLFRKPVVSEDYDAIKRLLKEVGRVVKEGCGDYWDGVALAVGMKQETVPNLNVADADWEDECRDLGWEWIDGEGEGKNEFNEARGIARIKEALESNDWEDNGSDLDLDLDGLNELDDESGFNAEAIELEMEMFGMKQAIYGGGEEEDGWSGSGEKNDDEDEDVEQLESMMLRLQAIKDMSADLPEAERKKFAAKAVNDIMKTL